MNQHRVMGKALALLIGAVLFLGVFFLARFLTRLPDLVILGSELMIIFLFGLIRAFWGPLAKHKAVRNVSIVRALPVGLLGLAGFLGSLDNSSYSVVLIGAAVLVQFVVVRRLMKELREQIREGKAENQANS